MIKQIGTLNIEIERRKIKNINIYVKPPNGDVLVTVPMRVSNEEVFRFLKKKEEWILKNHEKVKNRQNSSNHKISGYGLVLKDDIIHAPKHTLHIPLILQPAADSSESFYCEYYSFPILFSYLES